MNLKKLLAGTMIAGTLVVGAAGAASASEAGSGPAAPTTETGARAKHPGARAEVRKAVVEITLEVTQGTKTELRAAIADGGSLASFAESKGVEPQTLIDALVRAADARIDAAVDNGRMSSARAEKVKAKVPARVGKLVHRTRAGK